MVSRRSARRGSPRRSSGVAGGWSTSAPARSCARTSSSAAGCGSPRPQRAEGERKYLRSQGEIVHERPWPQSVEYVSMSAARRARPAVADRRRPARRRVRRDRRRQDDDGAAADRRAHARAEGGAAGARSEGRRGRRRADAPARCRRRRAVRPVRLPGPRDRSLAAVVGQPGRGRRASGRADQAVRALLLRRAAPAPRHRLQGAARRRPLAAVGAVPGRRLPAGPLPVDRRDRRAARPRAAPAHAPRDRPLPLRQLAEGHRRSARAARSGSRSRSRSPRARS